VWFVLFFSAGTAYAANIGSSRRRPLAADDAAAAGPTSSDVECSSSSSMGSSMNSSSVASSDRSHAPPTAAPEHGTLLAAAAASTTLSTPTARAQCRRLVLCISSGARSMEPAIYQMLCSVAIGCTQPLHEALSELGSLGWLGSAAHSLGRCQVVLSTVLLGAGLTNAWAAERRARRAARPKGRTATYVDENAAGAADAPVEADDGGGGGARGGHLGSASRGEARVFVAAACVLRLVVLPALCMPMHLALGAAGVLPADPTLLMVLTLSAGTPSSQTLVMVLNANGATAIAEEVSKVYVPMYLLSIFSVAALIFACCLLVGA
jgi:hypothetical protein